jgi:hypothetical protein
MEVAGRMKKETRRGYFTKIRLGKKGRKKIED